MSTTPIEVALSTRATNLVGLRTTLVRIGEGSSIRIIGRVNGGDGPVRLIMADEIVGSSQRAVVVNSEETEDTQRRVLANGASASITPDISPERLYAAITAVHNGLAVIPARHAAHLANRLDTPPNAQMLTSQQDWILHLLSLSRTVVQVSAELGCSERHTRRHLARLWTALGAADRTNGIIQATRYGLIGIRHPP